jgi:DNA-binding winged helix-turn-helix (wHTH) protein/Tfp pilus assembly protein PilF
MKFAGFEFDQARGELRFADRHIPLQDQLLKLFGLLLENPGEVVSRERIRLRLWGETHGNHEDRINTAVRKLRKALRHHAGDDAVCITTSASEGYRLVLPKQPARQDVAPDPVGRDAFLTGTFLFSQRNPTSLLAARQHFELACERNPEFALAHARLSRTCRFLTIFEMDAPGPLWQQAEKHAHRAVQLDPQLSEAHSAVACVLARYRWQWSDGCVAYEQALLLNPDDVETLCDYGVTLLAMGRLEEGVTHLDRVLTLDPRYAVGRVTVALSWMMQGRQEEAMAMLTGMTEAMPEFLTAWIYLAVEQLNRGDWAEAERSCRHLLELAPGLPTFLGLLSQAEAGLGRPEQVVALVARMEALRDTRYVSPTALAMVYLAAGETGAACRVLQRVVTERDANFALYRRMRCFDQIRETSEFLRTLAAMHLTQQAVPMLTS